MRTYDVIVIGLGGMGSAALYHLARRGLRVLGVEQFDVGHDRGSSHGETRIIRKAYFEHPDYVPLLDQTYMLWDRLEQDSGRELICRCGLVIFGRDDSAVLTGVRKAKQAHNLDIDALTPPEARKRFPTFSLDDGHHALLERDAGFLRVEACVRTHVEMARRHGAEIATSQTVRTWQATGSHVSVETESGRFEAGSLVLCVGAWTQDMLAGLNLPLRIQRKVVTWYGCHDRRMTVDAGCPVFAFDEGGRFLYGFPALDGALKAAEHTGTDEIPHPDRLVRSVEPDRIEPVNAFVAARLPLVRPVPTRSGVCMYTMTPDDRFIVGRHPGHPNVALAAGFSGHGFKFAPLVGTLLTDLVTGPDTARVPELMSIRRPELGL